MSSGAAPQTSEYCAVDTCALVHVPSNRWIQPSVPTAMTKPPGAAQIPNSGLGNAFITDHVDPDRRSTSPPEVAAYVAPSTVPTISVIDPVECVYSRTHVVPLKWSTCAGSSEETDDVTAKTS